VSGNGPWLIDEEGRRFFDGTSGSGAVGLGHQYPSVIKAAVSQVERLVHTGCKIGSGARQDLIDRLGAITPFAEPSVMPAATGAEAVEAALKIVRAATGRRSVMSFPRGYHGKTAGALSLSAREDLRRYSVLPSALTGPALPSSAAEVEVFLDTLVTCLDGGSEGAVAAVIIEPVQVTEGVFTVEPGLLDNIAARVRDAGALLVLDEIHTSIGRTGRLFYSDDMISPPDIILVGKALGNGFPIAAVTGERSILHALPSGVQTSTYAGHPVSAAAAVAVLDAVEQEQVVARAHALGLRMENWLQAAAARHEWVGEIRTNGALAAFDCVIADVPAPWLADRFCQLAADVGLLLFHGGVAGNTVKLVPPMLLDTVDEHFLADALASTFNDTDQFLGGSSL
jgi:4-aminobutyrate aminotransferase-like enzyme